MKCIGIVSDSHGFVDEKILEHLKDCDEVWHAGDIGKASVLDRLSENTELRAVYGNIDGSEIRSFVPRKQIFETQGLKVAILHIAGYPGKYNSEARKLIELERPDIFVCGHSHILKVMKDQKWGHLHINPGAMGKSGFHKIRTMIKIDLNKGKPSNLRVIEMRR